MKTIRSWNNQGAIELETSLLFGDEVNFRYLKFNNSLLFPLKKGGKEFQLINSSEPKTDIKNNNYISSRRESLVIFCFKNWQ